MSRHRWAGAASRAARFAVTVAVAAALSGCSADGSTGRVTETGPGTGKRTAPAPAASAAELAALKQRAGIEPCPKTPGATRPIEGGLPELRLPCLGGGRTVELSALRGTPVVLNVWAQWCGPCREEIPLFQRLHERTQGELRVIGVDVEDPQQAMALAFAADVGMTYPQLQDLDGALLDALRVRGVPLTILVGAGGRIAHVRPAPVASGHELSELVAEQLGVSVR